MGNKKVAEILYKSHFLFVHLIASLKKSDIFCQNLHWILQHTARCKSCRSTTSAHSFLVALICKHCWFFLGPARGSAAGS